MKISVITVTYNSGLFLPQCIQSVISQHYKNVEHIIIDGGSSDNTIDIIKQYNNHIHKWVSEPDRGIYDAINKGINLATGDVVGILNSDDFFADNDVLKRIAVNFQNDASLDAVFSDVLFVQNQDISKPVRHYSSKFFRPVLFRFGFQPAHPTFYAKRTEFSKYGNYSIDLKIAGDFELMMRFMLIHKIKYKYVQDIWVKMRLGGVSTAGVKSILLLNNEIVLACKRNKIYTNKCFVYSKYLVKWWGFFKFK